MTFREHCLAVSRRYTSRQRGNSLEFDFYLDKETLPIYTQIFADIIHDKKESIKTGDDLEEREKIYEFDGRALGFFLYADDRGGGRCTDVRTLFGGRRRISSTETLRARRTTETDWSFTLDTDSRR